MSDPTAPKIGLMVRSTRLDKEQYTKTQIELYPGDSIEYGITHEVELADHTKMWVRVGAQTHVAEGETAREAADRLAGYVADQVKYRIMQAVADAGDIHL